MKPHERLAAEEWAILEARDPHDLEISIGMEIHDKKSGRHVVGACIKAGIFDRTDAEAIAAVPALLGIAAKYLELLGREARTNHRATRKFYEEEIARVMAVLGAIGNVKIPGPGAGGV